MRWIILIVILALVAAGLGWLYIRDTDDTMQIIIDKEEVLTDTEEVIERGRNWIEDAADEPNQPAQDGEADVPEERERPEQENPNFAEPEREGVNR